MMNTKTQYFIVDMDVEEAALFVRKYFGDTSIMIATVDETRYGGVFFEIFSTFAKGYSTVIEIDKYDEKLMPKKTNKDRRVDYFGTKTIIKLNVRGGVVSVAYMHHLFYRIVNSILLGLTKTV